MRDLEISYDGDIVQNVKFKRGQNVRPLWRTLESLTPAEMIFWVDRFDSLCPLSAEWAVAQALESSAGIILPERLQFVRSIYVEINRLVYLTTYLAEIVKTLGLQTAYQQILILREHVFQKQEEFMGGRILPQALTFGGVRRDLAMGDVQKVRLFVQGWRFGWEKWKDLIVADPILESRLEGLLKISQTEIKKRGFWGVVGKGSGVVYDARLHQPHGAYANVRFDLKYDFELTGDALSRFNVAMSEVSLSLFLMEQFLQNISSEDKKPNVKQDLKAGIFSGSSESAKGPVTAVLEIDGTQRVRSVKVFATAQRVWPILENYFTGIKGEDFELAWASLGISGEEAEI